MKKTTYIFSIITLLLSLYLTSYGQNYIPYLKENHKYSIFNSTDSTFSSIEEYDYANVTLSEKYIEVGNYINDQLKRGLLDTYSGKLLFPIKYAEITVLENDLFIVSEEYNKHYSDKLIDKNQNILFENFRGYEARKYFDSNNKSFRILAFENGIKIIDSTGKLLLSKSGIKLISYSGNNIFNFSYDKELMLYPPTKWGIMHISGKIIFQPKYESISRINDNLFRVGVDVYKTLEKTAVIDLNGKEIVPFNFYKYLDHKNGNIIISFHEGESIVLDSKGKLVVNKILDKSKNKFYNFEFTENPKLFKIYLKNGKNTIENLIDKKGNKLFKTNYSEIHFLDQSHLMALDFNGKYYILNLKGEIKYSFSIKNNNFRLLEDKKLICYQKINSPMWEIITYQGDKSDYFKLDANINFSRISNEIILSEDSTGISFFNLIGEKLFQVFANGLHYPHNTELESSKSTSLYEFSYPEKISNKFLTYGIGDVRRSFTVWFGISNKCEYSFKNKELFDFDRKDQTDIEVIQNKINEKEISIEINSEIVNYNIFYESICEIIKTLDSNFQLEEKNKFDNWINSKFKYDDFDEIYDKRLNDMMNKSSHENLIHDAILEFSKISILARVNLANENSQAKKQRLEEYIHITSIYIGHGFLILSNIHKNKILLDYAMNLYSTIPMEKNFEFYDNISGEKKILKDWEELIQNKVIDKYIVKDVNLQNLNKL